MNVHEMSDPFDLNTVEYDLITIEHVFCTFNIHFFVMALGQKSLDISLLKHYLTDHLIVTLIFKLNFFSDQARSRGRSQMVELGS